jgi:hypothetical protein
MRQTLQADHFSAWSQRTSIHIIKFTGGAYVSEEAGRSGWSRTGSEGLGPLGNPQDITPAGPTEVPAQPLPTTTSNVITIYGWSTRVAL